MPVKFTVKCPKSPSGFKNVPHEEREHYALLKNNPNNGMAEEVLIQNYEDRFSKTDSMNTEFRRIRTELKKRLNYQGSVVSRTYEEVDGKAVTGTIDGCLIVTCDNTVAEVEKVINDLDLEIMPDEPRYKIFTKSIMGIKQRQKEIEGVKQFEDDGTTPIMEDN